jgi:hypothetical protein
VRGTIDGLDSRNVELVAACSDVRKVKQNPTTSKCGDLNRPLGAVCRPCTGLFRSLSGRVWPWMARAMGLCMGRRRQRSIVWSGRARITTNVFGFG